ncbi:chemotaxis protein CheA [Parasalinivibrio latis]|uniref:chemotaxis protein CheA n=1 Tax=Parasalinivibrio latis TaxID=2952610 RepID=UPI0030E21EE9
MSLDMAQLRAIFYQECRENLEVLERELLGLDTETADPETINTIFRAAHSIKGGSATFELGDIADFTHVMETLLDEVRDGKRQLDAGSVDLLLKGSDCITDMLVCHESGETFDPTERDRIEVALQSLLNGDSGASEAMSAEPEESGGTAGEESDDDSNWIIHFKPLKDIFFSGNDPLRLIRELVELDEDMGITCHFESLPDMTAMEPELCYLYWEIQLGGFVERIDIEEVFEWVEDECDLSITRDTSLQREPEKIPAEEKAEPLPEEPALKVEHQEQAQPAELKPADPKPTAPAKKKASKPETGVSSIRVDIDKIDNLINLVGELVITQSMLTELSQDFTPDKLAGLKSGLDQLLQNTKELQESVLNIRMLPISFAFNRFPRLIRDLSGQLGKQVELNISGEHTELDKTVLERITDPLVHLVRNAVDHGIEQPRERLGKEKAEYGTVSLNAYHQSGSIIIEVRDDGAGLSKEKLWAKAQQKGIVPEDALIDEWPDHQVFNIIFAPGFSTAVEVSDISGRGVGMDVVRRNIEDLGGSIEVESEIDVGSLFRISLPLTLAILDGQLVRLCDQIFVVPLVSIVESIQIDASRVKVVSGGIELYRLRENNIPILRLQDELDLGKSTSLDDKLLCVVEAGGNQVGLLLDDLLGQQQVVIKSLDTNYTRVPGFSGATILGDGSVSLILDVQGMISSFLSRIADGKSTKAA